MSSRLLLRALATLAATLLIGAAGDPAQAFRPQEGAAPYEIPLRAYDLHNYSSVATQEAAALAEQSLTARYPGTWKVYSWNPQTQTAALLYGSGVSVAAGLSGAADVEAAARQVIAANPAVFRADPENLRLTATPHAMGKWAAHFQQTYSGLDVWGGRVSLTFTDAGRLFAMGTEYYSGIDLDPTPRVSAAEAGRLACAALPYDDATDSVEGAAELLVLPVPLSESAVSYHLVWRVRVSTRSPLGIWVTHVDAHDGTILWRYNDIHFADFYGDAAGSIEPATWCNGGEDQPLRYMLVGITGVGQTITDLDGNWRIPYAGGDDRVVMARLQGPYVDVNNVSGFDALYEETVSPGSAHHIYLDDWWAQRDERDCFDAVNDVHDFMMSVDPVFPLIHQVMTCNVSIDDHCNAYWNGTINFFLAGDGCANTGQIQGVVHHEYGHGIQHAILGWQGDQGLGEGNSDIIANLITQESVIGRGFYQNDCVNGIRNSDNNLVYPDDVINQQIHYAGQVIAGFHWDFMSDMQDVYGPDAGTVFAAQIWHFCRRLELPTTQPAQVLAAFITDDDDGDLTNGTPHYEWMCAAATHHGFACPEVLFGVQIEHTPLLTQTEEGDVDVVAVVWSTEGAIDPDSVRLNYRIDGGDLVQATMLPTGQPDEYHGVIPDLRQGMTTEYYLRGVDLLGYAANDPSGAPGVMYSFGVATVYDPLETESGWVVNLEGTDTATRGQWVRVNPNGTRAQPEDDHTPDPGIRCWVTGNGPPDYPPGAYDVDHGVTSVCSPVYDLAGAEAATAGYWRWFSNDQDASPFEDAWGVWVRNNGGEWIVIEYTLAEDMNRWVSRGVDLRALFGEQIGDVQFKFAAADTVHLSMVEAGVDDLEIIARMTGDVPDAGGGAALGPRFALHGARGVPLTGAGVFSFQVPAAARVRLDLYDIAGRKIRALADDVFAAGGHAVSWDGRDGGGRALASGVYYLRMQTPGFSATRTLVLSR